ncbi:hypothetical protein N9D63_04065 [Opitutales bacterium]|jgi:hypothetical protein|nr:hypothetical protein [Verrucomicrobiales bacterium]MDA9962043.1 hypothetical protein [Opitutales bacterium]
MGHDHGDLGVSTIIQYRLKDGVGYVILQNGEPKSGKFEQALGLRLMKYADGK